MNSTVKGSKVGDLTTKNLMNTPLDEVVFQQEEESPMNLKLNMKNMHDLDGVLQQENNNIVFHTVDDGL